MTSPPNLLLNPCQILTTEQAASRVQELIDCYSQNVETPWVLPVAERTRVNTSFAALRRNVELVEGALVKICMCFDDTVLQNVVAIVICTHEQRKLLVASRSDEAATKYILPRAVVECMSDYLDTVIIELSLSLEWMLSGDGRRHVRTVNEAIQGMRMSLDSFLYGIEGWPLDTEQRQRVVVDAAPDLRLRGRNWVPMSVSDEDYPVGEEENWKQRLGGTGIGRAGTASPLRQFLERIQRGGSNNRHIPSPRPRPSAEMGLGYVSLTSEHSVSRRMTRYEGGLSHSNSSAPSSSSYSRKRRRHSEDGPLHNGESSACHSPSPSRHSKRLRRDQSPSVATPPSYPTASTNLLRRRSIVSSLRIYPAALRAHSSPDSGDTAAVDSDSDYEWFPPRQEHELRRWPYVHYVVPGSPPVPISDGTSSTTSMSQDETDEGDEADIAKMALEGERCLSESISFDRPSQAEYLGHSPSQGASGAGWFAKLRKFLGRGE